MKCQVRRAQTNDWETIRRVRLQALTDSPDAFGTLLAEDQCLPDSAWRARIADPDVAHFLADASTGSQVGMVVGAPYTGFENTAGLFGMWVSPDVRGQGIGSLLVDAVIEWARTAEYNRILLDVANDNLAAIHLYAAKGFLPTGNTSTLPPPRQHIQEHERCLTLEQQLEQMQRDATLVSAALTAADIKHRFEIYNDANTMVAYFHHNWLQPNDR